MYKEKIKKYLIEEKNKCLEEKNKCLEEKYIYHKLRDYCFSFSKLFIFLLISIPLLSLLFNEFNFFITSLISFFTSTVLSIILSLICDNKLNNTIDKLNKLDISLNKYLKEENISKNKELIKNKDYSYEIKLLKNYKKELNKINMLNQINNIEILEKNVKRKIHK